MYLQCSFLAQAVHMIVRAEPAAWTTSSSKAEYIRILMTY